MWGYRILFLIMAVLYPVSIDADTHHSVVLDNGLTVYLIQDPQASIVSARTYIRAGSIHEGPWLGTGVSHYLEHVVAGGATEKRSENAYKEVLSLLGGASNAYTTSDHTAYYINTVPEHTLEAISILHEWMFYCAFDDTEVDREHDVIIKEMEKNEAAIGRVFYQLGQAHFYQHHPARHPVIGYQENFKALTKQDLSDYYKQQYTPQNMVVVVGGNIDIEATLALIKKTFGQHPKRVSPIRTVTPEPRPFSARYFEKRGPVNVSHVSIKYPTVDLVSPALYPLDLLDYILGNGQQSILYQQLVEKEKNAFSVSVSSYTPPYTSGYFDITLQTTEDKTDAAIKSVKHSLDQLKQGRLISRALIQKAKKQKYSEDVFAVTGIERKVARIGESYMSTFSADMYERYVKNFDAVTKTDVIKTAKTFFLHDNAVVTVLHPKKEETDISVISTLDKPDNTHALITLPNGLRVIFIPDHSLPKVLVRVAMLSGVRAETETLNGVGNLLARSIGKGSKKYSKQQMREAIEARGADLNAYLGRNTMIVNFDCLSEDFNDLWPIVVDAILHPKLTNEMFDLQKSLITQAIKTRKDSWSSLAQYFYQQHFYAGHGYAYPILGEIESVAALTKEDIYSWHQNMLQPEEMIITVAGDVNQKDMLEKITQSFSAIGNTPRSEMFLSQLLAPSHGDMKITKIQIPQPVGAVFIGFDGVRMQEKEKQLKIDVLDAVLSGMNYPGGRLHEKLRGLGLVYMVHARHYAGFEGGDFLIYALTSPDKIEQVKTTIFEEINDLQKYLISEKDFKKAIAEVGFYYQDRMARLSDLALVMTTDTLYGKGVTYSLDLLKELKTVTREDVQAMASELFQSAQVFEFVQEKKASPIALQDSPQK